MSRRHVLGGGDDAAIRRRGFELRDGAKRAEDGCAARHVGLHLVHIQSCLMEMPPVSNVILCRRKPTLSPFSRALRLVTHDDQRGFSSDPRPTPQSPPILAREPDLRPMIRLEDRTPRPSAARRANSRGGRWRPARPQRPRPFTDRL